MTNRVTFRLESGLFAAFLAVLVWAPLPFASNRVWGAMLLSALVALLCAGWAALYALGRARLQPDVWQRGRWPLALLCIVQLWVFLQTLPLPRDLVTFLSPQASQWRLLEGPVPLSLDPENTRLYLLRGLGFTGAFFLTLALVNCRGRVRLLLQVLLFSGLVQAVYGSMMVISGLELGFFVEKYAGQGVVTGTFINRNHMAGYLVMCLAAGIGLSIAQMRSVPAAVTWRENARRALRAILSSKVRLRIYLAIMIIALVMTRSRMGNLAFFASVMLASCAAMAAGRQFSGRLVLMVCSLFVVDVLILGRWFGFDRLVGRLERSGQAVGERAETMQAGFEFLGQFWLTGSGGGSFYGIVPNFQPAATAALMEHAHNDYLEFAAELGVPALLLLVSVALASAWQAWRAQAERQRPVYRGAAFAVLMSCIWLALHSAVDFNMQVPANALTICVLLACAWVCRWLPDGGREGSVA